MIDLNNVGWPDLFGPITAVDTVLVPGYVDDDSRTSSRHQAVGRPPQGAR